MKDLEAVVPQSRYSSRHLSAGTDTFQWRQPVSRPIFNVQQTSGRTKYKITYCSETLLTRLQNTEGLSRNRCCSGRARSVTYSECVFVSLVIQLAMRNRPIIWSSVACLVFPYFYTLPHKWHDFRKEIADHKMCVLRFYKTLGWNISHSKKKLGRHHKCTYVFT
jgi:hypothetical protein